MMRIISQRLRLPVLPQLVFVAWVVVGLIGCKNGPLEDTQAGDPRNPFSAYRQLRQSEPDRVVEDALGQRKPNLRERLIRSNNLQ